ncbi:butyrophilin subfamily 3 member A2-like [Etheostoma cragini]|uniref:butyrophilin subfamily 3 member A2-like n=1 Tax=Etheostoma cragini TaxID=417921 RepID=UPI00155E377E|nr:butyrophilin subfamily 3 member A2-like [Etheostoma cragini]
MMPPQTDRLAYNSPPIVCSTLSLQYAVALLLLTHSRQGQSQAIGQPQPIVALVGNDITLPCHVKPATDAVNQMVEWSRLDLNPRFVHVRRSGDDRLVDQNPSYMGRTWLSINGLRQGDASLTLSRLELSDEGTYRCFIPGLTTESSVQLVVVSSPVIKITELGSGVLQCESGGWYPEPEVSWLDAEGNLLSAGPTETIRGPDDLYTVSSRVTVEKRPSNRFTCRVQQKDTNQTRETRIYVQDDFFTDLSGSGSGSSIIIGLVGGVLLILAVALVVWKWRANKTKTRKQQEDEETPRGGENSTSNDSEQKCLIERESEDRETVNNQNKKEEENNTSYQTEEETHQEKTEGETGNILNQRQELCANAKTEEERKSITVETAAPGPTQSLMDGHGQQQQDTAADANNDIGKEETEEDIKSAEDKASSQGPTDDQTQHNDPSAGGGKQNDSELITVAESGHKVKNGDRRDGGGNPTCLPPAKPDRLFKTEPQTDLNKKNEDNKTESTDNQAAGPTEGQPPHHDGPAVGGTNNTSDQTGGPSGKSDDTPVPAERRRQKGQQEEGGKSLMEGDGQQQLKVEQELSENVNKEV